MKVIDDVLTKEEHQAIYDVLMGPHYPWFWNDYSTIVEPLGDNGYNYTQMANIVIFGDNITCGETFDLFYPLFEKLGCKEVHRCKVNLMTYDPEMGDDMHGAPHVDMDEEMTTAVYYVNDSDGDTYLFEDTIQRVSPKANRALVFNSMTKHAGSQPKKTRRRVVININYR